MAMKAVSAEELDLVRGFVDEDTLQAIVEILTERLDTVHGVKASGSAEVPGDTHATVSFTHTVWDSDAYFAPGQPTRLTVPTRRAGRYFVQVAVCWISPQGQSPPGSSESYYCANITLNGNQNPPTSDARSTAGDVEGWATGTTQHFTFETNLSGGDYLELRLWQMTAATVSASVHFQMRRVGR